MSVKPTTFQPRSMIQHRVPIHHPSHLPIHHRSITSSPIHDADHQKRHGRHLYYFHHSRSCRGFPDGPQSTPTVSTQFGWHLRRASNPSYRPSPLNPRTSLPSTFVPRISTRPREWSRTFCAVLLISFCASERAFSVPAEPRTLTNTMPPLGSCRSTAALAVGFLSGGPLTKSGRTIACMCDYSGGQICRAREDAAANKILENSCGSYTTGWYNNQGKTYGHENSNEGLYEFCGA
ncbi:hypothetical protein B0H66DRAFT_344461 [Apodospora peruviana]|uniref:Uncharacterized protein n=1 Tax=Apodospora peruviana TaxID=516989 RepID=A0AAE0HYY9_9PEZI|nr:hypothetical protein B0H66DRAFT_344461 [Apodospora peruviana]